MIDQVIQTLKHHHRADIEQMDESDAADLLIGLHGLLPGWAQKAIADEADGPNDALTFIWDLCREYVAAYEEGVRSARLEAAQRYEVMAHALRESCRDLEDTPPAEEATA